MSDSGSGLLIKTVFILTTVFTIIAHNIGTHINVLDYQQIYMISHAIKLLKMHKWVSSRENLSSGGGGGGGCEQQRHRPACASAQNDQRLCYSLIGKYHM